MNFIDDLENRVYHVLEFKTPKVERELLDPQHILLKFPRNKIDAPEKSIESIADIAETFLVQNKFNISNKITDGDFPYKTQCMTAEREGNYYAVVIGAKQEDEVCRLSVIKIDFISKN